MSEVVSDGSVERVDWERAKADVVVGSWLDNDANRAAS